MSRACAAKMSPACPGPRHTVVGIPEKETAAFAAVHTRGAFAALLTHGTSVALTDEQRGMGISETATEVPVAACHSHVTRFTGLSQPEC